MQAASPDPPPSGYAGQMAEIVPFERGGVHGFLHRPQGVGKSGLALTHGAGGNCAAPLLSKIAEAFCAAGLSVLRFDLPFRQRRPRGPPSPAGAAADRAGIAAAVSALREIAPGPVWLGGHSYGGRQASLVAAEDPQTAAGLLLLSYPLHAPGRPGQPRAAHLPRLFLPTVFVHGTKDPFGTIDELRAALSTIPLPARLCVIDGAGHDLRRGNFDSGPVVRALIAT
jgi:predicted alpha/beta-hydrolase family hydrolase